uniref:Ig-like domain-containing protein n=1 Tax=Chelonoidis abingdonii TaxID=106734 RepID=A0A8C0GYP0_CHEAB
MLGKYLLGILPPSALHGTAWIQHDTGNETLGTILLIWGCCPISLTLGVEVSGPPGGTVSVPCQYGKRDQRSQKYWCRGAQWKSCSKVVETENSEVKEKRGRVSITDNHTMSTFTVTMENLTLGDAGIYWCGINIKGGSDPHSLVNVTVLPGSLGAGGGSGLGQGFGG